MGKERSKIMEENNKFAEEEIKQEGAEGERAERPVHGTKQQNFLYTVLSVALFFLIYFAVKGITFTVNRPYKMFAYEGDLSPERTAEAASICGILPESEYRLGNVRLEKEAEGYVFTALFLLPDEPEDDDLEAIAGEIIAFEYGDPEDDIRTEFYPYPENPYYAEYAYGERFVDIEASAREVVLFSWDGAFYAKYRQYGSSVPSEIKALLSGMEKVY